MDYVIGIDLGGTNLRIAIINRDGSILNKRIYNTYNLLKNNLFIDTIYNHVIDNENKISAIGIGVPGIVLVDKGVVVESPNIPEWRNFELKKEIEKRIKIPVFLDNDANVSAYGEKWIGAGKYFDSFVCITLGTGVGGGIILNGEIWHGKDGMAGEIGHTVVEVDGERCKCGGYGCLEVYASANAIVKMARDNITNGENSIIKNMVGGNLDKIDSHIVYKAGLKGDKLSLRIYEKVGRYLGIGIANVINLLNIDGIIIGGGVSKAWDLFIDSLKKEVRGRVFSYVANNVKIVKSELMDNAGIIGASYIAFKEVIC
jgi:glucokinase